MISGESHNAAFSECTPVYIYMCEYYIIYVHSQRAYIMLDKYLIPFVIHEHSALIMVVVIDLALPRLYVCGWRPVSVYKCMFPEMRYRYSRCGVYMYRKADTRRVIMRTRALVILQIVLDSVENARQASPYRSYSLAVYIIITRARIPPIIGQSWLLLPGISVAAGNIYSG